MNDYSSNPKITFAEIKLQDVLEAQNIAPDSDFDFIVKHREETLVKYQPIFSPEHIPFLTKSEFYDFLLFRNNHHWTNINRVGKYMVEDIDLLREAITILLDESMSVEDRINQLRPERYWGTNSMVSHMGMPVLSAILLIVHPEKYGVWNNTSDAGMKLVRLWDKNWETQPTGKTYIEMNQIYHELSLKLNVDLWTLDALWWVLKKTQRRSG